MNVIVEDKTVIRAEIGQAVAAFLKRGGKVEQHPVYTMRDTELYGDMARNITSDASAAKRGRDAWVPDAGYVNIRQLAGMTGLADCTLRRMAKRGDFPPACKIGHKRTQWWRIERIQATIEKIRVKKDA